MCAGRRNQSLSVSKTPGTPRGLAQGSRTGSKVERVQPTASSQREHDHRRVSRRVGSTFFCVHYLIIILPCIGSPYKVARSTAYCPPPANHVRTPIATSYRYSPTDRIITDARALIRLQNDHIGRTLVPSFYRYLQAQDSEKQIAGGRELHQAIETLVGLFERATIELGNDPKLKKYLGLYAGGELGFADILVAPCTCHLSESLFSEWGNFIAHL